MKKHMVISLIIIAIGIIVPVFAYAAFPINLQKSFGGRVILTTIPLVTCTGTGTGPITLLMSNGLSIYTTSTTKTPKFGDWILGNKSIIPDFTTCKLQAGPYQIPYPVSKTSDYNISGAAASLGF